MNKSKYLVLSLLLMCLMFIAAAFSGCGKDGDYTKEFEGLADSLYYKPQGYADKIYAIAEDDLSSAELVAVESLQGILAQEKATVCIIDNKSCTFAYVRELAIKYDLQVQILDDAWTLINTFDDQIVGKKYVRYNLIGENGTGATDQTINYATTVAGAEKYLMISGSLEQRAIAEGYTLGRDVTRSTTRGIFEEYKDRLNKSYLIHQKPSMPYLRDYSIAGGAMCFYSDYYDGDSDVKMDILRWADRNAPILGWTENEVNFVSSNSLMSKITVAADWASNLSFLSAETRRIIQQKNYAKRTVTPEKGKHYVAVMMSDGDNVQWMTRDFARNEKFFNSEYRGAFPMTWTTSPSLYDLAPDTLHSLYSSATARDEFIAGPSGVGYVNATEYNAESLNDYAGYTAGYMEKTDIKYINFLDNNCDRTMLDAFAQYRQVEGGVWSVGDKYIEGFGNLYWANDKPFLAVRDTLWRIAGDDESNRYYGYVERVAQRINKYKRDYTAIEGYTLVAAHAWSIGSMDYVNRFVNGLDDDVVLVTVGEMLDMISRYVPHENAEVDDIVPWDIADDKLAPISSEQYDWNKIKGIRASDERDFEFLDQTVASKWHSGTGGLEYDKVMWVPANTMGEPSVMLDGSDLEDVVDPLPNAWIYAKFNLSTQTDLDNYLILYACGGLNADVNMRVRLLYEENGAMKTVVLNSQVYDHPLDEHGWFRRDGSSAPSFIYDLRAWKGKSVIVSIEQDDTGDGSGEILYISQVSLVGEIVPEEEVTNWEPKQIFSAWKRLGSVERHAEGVCLEAKTGEASVSKDIIVTQDTKYIKFYVRMFERAGTPDTPPLLTCYINGVQMRAIGSSTDAIRVTGDEYRCIAFDLSDFAGKVITLKFASSEGDHAALGKILLADSYSSEELLKQYTDSEIKAL